MKEEEREKRIEKLRRLSKTERKEIEEAHSLIKGTEDIIKERPIKEEVRIPEIEAHIEQIVRPRPRRDYAAEEEEVKEERQRETRLEETVEHEAEERSIGEKEAEQNVQYNLFRQEFQGQRTEDIYSAVRDVYQRMRTGGEGPNSEEMDMINAARYVAHKREEEIGRGDYGRISEEVSQKLVMTERLGAWMSRMYKH